jgi:hypothetical protein
VNRSVVDTRRESVLREETFQQLLAAAYTLQEQTNRSAMKNGRPDQPETVSDARIGVAPTHSGRRRRKAAASAQPLLILLIIIAFLLSLLWGHESVDIVAEVPSKTTKIASDESMKSDEAVQRNPPATGVTTKTGLPSFESSHLHVTDSATASVVYALSPHEIKQLRRQAEYGDDAAAMVLGMAYEMGHYVPQSCAKAANWVTIAAAEGNAAAQYNLGLRYLYGDGLRISPEEAKKWLQTAATRRYPKAELALQTQLTPPDPDQ